jgi:putative endonuclease
MKDHKFYIGFTVNIERRFNQHKTGKVISTKNRRPLLLIYYEAYFYKKDAKGREKFLKGGSGHKFLRKQLTTFLSKHPYSV